MRQYYELAIDYFQDEDGIFTAVVPALPGCAASGETLDETYKNIVGAIESCIEVRKKLNMPVPGNSYVGKNNYRIPVAAWQSYLSCHIANLPKNLSRQVLNTWEQEGTMFTITARKILQFQFRIILEMYPKAYCDLLSIKSESR